MSTRRRAFGLGVLLSLGACSNVDVIDDDGPDRPGASSSVSGSSGSSGGGSSSTGSASSSGSAVSSSASSGGAGGSECSDGPDLCDGIDSDCDGSVDEDDPVTGTLCETGQVGPCTYGAWSCETGFPTCVPDVTPEPELCDTVDNDCDGDVDEGMNCAPKRVFVSSQVYLGSLGGLAGADEKCQTLADAVGLGGTYRAWLSDAVTSAKDRLVHASVPYVLVDGTEIASNWAQLVDGGLAASIHLTELGTTPGPTTTVCDMPGDVFGPKVWTGTLADGSVHSTNQVCVSWSSSSMTTGTVGCAFATGNPWSVCCSAPPCTDMAHLYCLEQ